MVYEVRTFLIVDEVRTIGMRWKLKHDPDAHKDWPPNKESNNKDKNKKKTGFRA